MTAMKAGIPVWLRWGFYLLMPVISLVCIWNARVNSAVSNESLSSFLAREYGNISGWVESSVAFIALVAAVHLVSRGKLMRTGKRLIEELESLTSSIDPSGLQVDQEAVFAKIVNRLEDLNRMLPKQHQGKVVAELIQLQARGLLDRPRILTLQPIAVKATDRVRLAYNELKDELLYG